ncbi:aspartate aminotransferase family protein [Salinibacter sp. 10B]|uniref:pyridoxal phosphate-dependent decarboxylase family protein n=1 Tax=Salinibacter sp. 10B TaxID=1923971 RepID=UPI000CF46A4D|nr:aminotransferase class V-fold PLP-dependent enzyme [Salinibacter sp. 10B]PQJ35863.1 aspartate aminotransferase family protein [Salinibacter sp. 10B]
MSYPSAQALLHRALQHVEDWEASWGSFEHHSSIGVNPDRLDAAMDEYLERLEGNYPFHHPRYAGQMLKPPHPVALAAYTAAQRINPNNHALDGGPPTSQMEQEVVADLAEMLGLPDETLGHLTGGGTVANLEALWVARELHPDQAIAVSENAHYTHGRMSEVLKMEMVSVPTDTYGRLDLDALDTLLDTHDIGTVVLTAGTTGLGTVDPIADALPLCRDSDARVHVDAAYGGFFRLMTYDQAPDLNGFPASHFEAIAESDSVAIDPHKHGLQPYGCGCILFRDPTVGRFYQHDSPYTYFTSDELHLGEISLECSRAGAAAGALWCTLKALPLAPNDGVGAILAACLRAARTWAEAVETSDALTLLAPPETDIVAYFPTPDSPTLSAVDAASQRLFETAMNATDDPVFTSLYRLPAETLQTLHPSLKADQDDAAVLRSVLMKPEHETYADALVERLSSLAA